MSDYEKYDRCKICGEFGWKSTHTCPPRWEAMYVDHDDEDNPGETFGDTAEDAAHKYVDDNFVRWEYPEEMEIWVRQSKKFRWQKFVVGVESVPQFNVYPKKE
jgi:hypothetical protein